MTSQDFFKLVLLVARDAKTHRVEAAMRNVAAALREARIARLR